MYKRQGTQASLAAAAARGVLGSGLSLDQSLLNRLLAGDARFGAPALEMLTLSVADAFNFYGDVYKRQSGDSEVGPSFGRSYSFGIQPRKPGW